MVRRWLVDETAKADENEDENKKEGRRPKAGAREAQAEQNRGGAKPRARAQ